MENVPQISKNEVLEVVRKKLKTDEVNIAYFSLNIVGEWIGMCDVHAILNVVLESSNKTTLTFFVKLYPRAELIVNFIEETGSFRKEIFIYKLFDNIVKAKIHILSHCIPELYLTATNKYLVMENLLEEGYVTLNKYKYCEYSTIEVVLQAVAKLHASSLIYEEEKCCRFIDDYKNEFEETYFKNSETFNYGLEAAFKGIVNCIRIFEFPEKLLTGKHFEEVLKDVCYKIYDLARPSKQYRNVICHGDLWASNIMVRYDEKNEAKNCKLVDFQCGRYAPPAQDVLSFIYLTTSREFRQKYMYNLIGMYYNYLEKHVNMAGYNMKNVILFDEFLNSCEEQKGFALVQAAVYFPLILLKSEVAREYFENTEIDKKCLYEDRSLLVLKHMNEDSDYKTRMKESIQDLKEYCDYL